MDSNYTAISKSSFVDLQIHDDIQNPLPQRPTSNYYLLMMLRDLLIPRLAMAKVLKKMMMMMILILMIIHLFRRRKQVKVLVFMVPFLISLRPL
jgi:hypothetical protein